MATRKQALLAPAQKPLLDAAGVEAALAGHVHNFFFHATAETDFYTMLSTCLVGNDYQELFSIAPVTEFGRNNEPKLGWAEVNVYATGHDITFHRMMLPQIYANTLCDHDRGST